MKKTILIIAVLLMASSAFAQTTAQPAISNVQFHSNASNPSTATVTWDTSTGADAVVGWGDTANVGDAPVSAAGVFPDPAAITDTVCCVTTGHSATLTGLYPGEAVAVEIRSRGFTSGVADQAKATFLQPANFTNAALPVTAGAYDYYLGLGNYGGPSAYQSVPHNVVQGYETYIPVFYGPLIRPTSIAGGTVTVNVSGLPTGVTVDFPDADVSSWTQTGTTGTLVLITQGSPASTNMRITTTGATAIQSATITFASSGVSNGINAPAHSNITTALNVIAPSFTFGTPSSSTPIDATTLSTLKSSMVTYGQKWQGSQSAMGCLDAFPANGESVMFYDGARVYRQIQAYDSANNVSGNPSQWNTAIANCTTTYRNWLLAQTPPAGQTFGYYGFGQGLYQDYVANLTADSATALDDLAQRIFGNALPAVNSVLTHQRETAFIADVDYWDTQMFTTYGVGSDRSARVQRGITMTIDQLDQIGRTSGYRPYEFFMLGLQAEPLIRWYQNGHQSDIRIPMAIKAAADRMWNDEWVAPTGAINTGTFGYDTFYKGLGNDPTQPGYTGTSDYRAINALSAAMYAWLYTITGDSSYQNKADTLVVQNFITNQAGTVGFTGKNFSQVYRNIFDYMAFRNQVSSTGKIRFSKGARVRGGSKVIIR